MKFKFFNIYLISSFLFAPTAVISSLSSQVANVGKPVYERAIPTEMLKKSADGQTLLGFADGVTVADIQRNNYNTLRIPDGVTKIGNYAFAYAFDGLCCRVESLILTDEVETIGSHAFTECMGIKYVNFDELSRSSDCKLRKIGTSAFYKCGYEGSLTIPSSVEVIDEYCFDFCTEITQVIFNKDIQTIGFKAFAYDEKLAKIDFSCYTRVPEWLYSLNSIFAGIGVRTSETKLITIDTTIDDLGVWQDCLLNRQKLTTGEATNYEYHEIKTSVPEDVLLISREEKEEGEDDYILEGIDEDKISIDDFCKYNLFVIPEQVTKISDEAFKNVITENNGAHMTISFSKVDEKITEIGESAFENCTGLVGTMTMPSKTEKLGRRAFYNTGFKSIFMSPSLTHIGTEAFANNSQLIQAGIACEVDIQKLKSWGDGKTFRNCPKLQIIDFTFFSMTDMPEILKELKGDKVIFKPNEVFPTGFIVAPNTAGWLDIIKDEDEWNFNCFSPTDPNAKWGCIPPDPSTCADDYLHFSQSGTVLEGLTSAGLKHKDDFSSIQLPYNIQSIGIDSFNGVFPFDFSLSSTNTWNFSFNRGLSRIEDGAFANCSGISQLLQLPDSLKWIGDKAFYNCISLRGDFKLPQSIEHIGDHAFMGSKLSGTLDIPGGVTIGVSSFANSLFNKLVIQDGKITFGSRFMAGNNSLTEIDLRQTTIEAVRQNWSFVNDSFFVNPTAEEPKVYVNGQKEEWENLLKNQMGLPSNWQIV